MQHDYVFPTGKKVRAPSDKLNATFIKGLPESLEGEAGKILIVSEDETTFTAVDPFEIETDAENVSINTPIEGLDSTNVYDALVELSLSGGGGGSGDVTGPASSTDNAVARFHLATGKIIQNSSVTIDDSGNISTSGTVDGRDLSVDGTKLDGIESGAQVNDPTPTASDILLNVVSGSTYSTVQDSHNVFCSVGTVSGGSITDDADGTITVSSGNGTIRAINSDVADILFVDWAAESGANVNLTDNDMNYVYVEYNSGTPQIVATTTKRTDLNTNIFLGTVYREGTELHITEDTRSNVGNAASKIIQRLQATQPFEYESGALLTETGTLNIAVSAGVFWEGITRFTTSSFDSSVADTFTYVYKDGLGGWTKVTAQTDIDNTQYDDGSGTLATLSNNKYGVHWVYMENDSSIFVIYGQGSYTLSEAQNAASDGIPEQFNENHARLIGKIIVEKDASVFTEVLSILDSVPVPTVIDHGDLYGLGDDDHTQYALGAADSVADEVVSFSNTDGRTLKRSGLITSTSLGGTILRMVPFSSIPDTGDLVDGDTFIVDDGVTRTYNYFDGSTIYSVELA